MATIGELLSSKGQSLPPIKGRSTESEAARRKRMSDDLMRALIADSDAEEEQHYLKEMGCGDPEH